jgi:hypothetical protein
VPQPTAASTQFFVALTVNVHTSASFWMMSVPVNPEPEKVTLAVAARPFIVSKQVSIEPLHVQPVVPPSFGYVTEVGSSEAEPHDAELLELDVHVSVYVPGGSQPALPPLLEPLPLEPLLPPLLEHGVVQL